MFCLFLDGPITGPSGGRGLISVCVGGGGEYKRNDSSVYNNWKKKHSCTKSRENKVKI